MSFLKNLLGLEKPQPAYRAPVIDPCEQRYFQTMSDIEAMWSVLYNLKQYSGAQADVFEQTCLGNIRDFLAMAPDRRYGTREVPAYTRLAMLYEKQERYEEAVLLCAAAIRNGITYDGSKGQMYGRLARLIRKSGKDIDPEILALSQGG